MRCPVCAVQELSEPFPYSGQSNFRVAGGAHGLLGSKDAVFKVPRVRVCASCGFVSHFLDEDTLAAYRQAVGLTSR
jgi:hypothetical protein